MNINALLNKKLFKAGVTYSTASTLSSFISMFASFVSMLWIGPERLGIWQSVTIVNYYIIFLQLGIQSGLNLDLPIQLGKNNNEESEKLVKTGLAFAHLLSFTLLILGCLCIGWLFYKNINIDIIFGFLSVVIIAIISSYKLHFLATYRSALAFEKLASIYFVNSVVNLLLIYFIYKYHYYGLLLFHVGKEFFLTFMMYYSAPYRRSKPHFYIDSFKKLLKRGLFMTFINQVKGLIESAPRLLVLTLGGTLQLGLFTPALSMGLFMNLIPVQISQFLNPQFGYSYGKNGKAKDMWKYLKKVLLYTPLISIPFAIVGWFLIPFVLEWFLPKYLSSLWPFRIMLIGYIFSSTFISRGFLITIKAYTQTVFLYILDLVFFFSLPRFLCFFYPKNILISVSIGLSIAYILTYIINFIIVRHVLFLKRYNL